MKEKLIRLTGGTALGLLAVLIVENKLNLWVCFFLLLPCWFLIFYNEK